MNRTLLRPALALLIISVSFAASGCTEAASKTRVADAPIPVKLAPVTTEKMALPIVATGTLGAKEDLALGFKIGGVVARVLVNEGDRVRVGQVLAALDLGEIEPGVTRARAAADKAERDRARVERLYADSVATRMQLDDATTGRDAARAEYDAAMFNRRHAMIVAPADGVVLRRLAEPGVVLAAGTPAVVLASHARGQVVRIGLADRDVVRLREGDAASVRFDAYPERRFAGRVTEIGAAADPVTGTYRVEVTLVGVESLPSGFVATVELSPRSDTPVALVPIEALLEAQGEDGTVYSVSSDGQRAERHAVKVAFMAGERVALRSGLEGIASVVTAGAAKLDAGDRVEVVR